MMRPAAEIEQHSEVSSETSGSLESELLRATRDVHRLHREVESLRQRIALERDDREDLLAVVAHEVRTPLTVIRGYVRLLLGGESDPLTEEQERFLREAERSCDKLDDFVGRALEAARTPGEVEAIEVSTDSLRPLVEEVAGTLQGPLRERGLDVVLAVDSEHHARFDPNGIERVLLNLVGNAVRYARAEIRVASQVLCEGDRALVEISVSDDGPGVAEADRERIFTPYVRQGDARHGGVGLGLALCRRLVEAHGGSIGVAESDSGGCRFFFTLPGRDD